MGVTRRPAQRGKGWHVAQFSATASPPCNGDGKLESRALLAMLRFQIFNLQGV